MERPFGNTPTCVGKTNAHCKPLAYHRKHPHVRGEDRRRRSVLAALPETPPRAWGRRPHGGVNIGTLRNTPTCVGKTAFRRPSRTAAQKHPHVRGEDAVNGIQPNSG